jgi:NAD-dependent deacetylase
MRYLTRMNFLRDELARFVAEARRIVVFTGAGISTDSGIPDFRSPGGVWSKMQPIMFQDFLADEDARREAWRRVYAGAAGWTGKAPNEGHFAVARLIAAGRASSVITQNVDNLHQESGVPAEQVIELHGNASYAGCLDCGRRYELDEFRAAYLDHGVIPSCRVCGGWVKTATISFGQPMPELPMLRADEETRACDLFLVLGSSLVVTPAANFPIIAKRAGARLAIVNREDTPLDRLADLVLHDEIAPALRVAVAALGT